MKKSFNKKSPCPYCDSGLSYEKCCRKKILLIKQAKSKYKKQQEILGEFKSKYGSVEIPTFVEAYGKKLFSIGSDVLEKISPGHYTNFVEVIHDFALGVFGREYLQKQNTLRPDQRHPAINWMQEFIRSWESNQQTGGGAAWIRFAYDLYTIGASGENRRLEDTFRERIIKHHYFQGVRHELWVAALFITADFDIEFSEEKLATDPEVEFIATDKITGKFLKVEAKSKQKKGILGSKQGKDILPGEEVNIDNLLKKALRKENGDPLCVVIDTNLPPQEGEQNIKKWQNEIQCSMDTINPDSLSRANLILFYNDPSHYMANVGIGNEQDLIWFKSYAPHNPKNRFDNIDSIDKRLMKAQRQRICPPFDIPVLE